MNTIGRIPNYAKVAMLLLDPLLNLRVQSYIKVTSPYFQGNSAEWDRRNGSGEYTPEVLARVCIGRLILTQEQGVFDQVLSDNKSEFIEIYIVDQTCRYI